MALEFENIDPWINDAGDTGRTARLKLARNFAKIAAALAGVGHATLADVALIAQKLADDSSDWEKILRKDKDDSTLFNFGVGKNLTVGGNTTFGNYVKDTSGGAVTVDENQNTSAEFDFIRIRKTAYFKSVTIDELKHIGGELALTPAAMTCSRVEEQSDSYRCYFETTDGKQNIYQEFVVGDGARCQQFKYENSSNGYIRTKYYWRKVISIGDNYIDLSKTECDNSIENSTPSEYDNIVQFGYLGTDNINTYRRSAIILSTTSSDSPSMKMYQGINSFSLDGCLIKDEGYSNGIFHTNIYGNFFAGTKDNSSYLKFTAGNGVEIKGKLAEGTKLEDGTEVNSIPANIQNLATSIDGLHSGIFNIIRNSGFTGDYQNLELDTNTALNTDTELYNNKLIGWDNSNAAVSTDTSAQSGYSCSLSSGYISQSLYYQQIANESYVMSIKAKGTSITVEVGGKTFTQELTSVFATYNFKYKSSGGTTFRIAGTCVVSEIELAIGTVSLNWSQSPLDNHKMFDRFQTIKYITDAMADGSVQFSGGLALMTMIMLGNYKDGEMINVTSGLSGIYSNDNDVSFWSGGTFEQAIAAVQMFKNDPTYQPSEAELTSIAKAVITHGGRIIMNDAVVRGYIYALGGIFKNIKLSGSIRNPFENSTDNFNIDTNDNVIVIGAGLSETVEGNYTLPWTVDNNGRKITVANYKFGSNQSNGYVVINAPEGNFFYENNVQKSALAFPKNSIVELFGIGDSTTFFGWLVLHKKYFDGNWGVSMSALAYGTVTTSQGSSSILSTLSFWSCNNKTITVDRLDVGKYKITLPNEYSNYFVILTGAIPIISGGGVVNACLANQAATTFEVHTHDDDTLNDGSFNFIIYREPTAFNHV